MLLQVNCMERGLLVASRGHFSGRSGHSGLPQVVSKTFLLTKWKDGVLTKNVNAT